MICYDPYTEVLLRALLQGAAHIANRDRIITEPRPVVQAKPNARIIEVARELAEAFRCLVDALPGRPLRPLTLARTLKVDKTVSHRLVTAIREGDPLVTAHRVPGPEPLRRIASAARRHDVPQGVVERAESAIEAFESLIRDEGGDRAGLDAIISAWLPSARERFEREAKQSLYRGARQLKGLCTDVLVAAHLVHPGADSSMCDCVSVFGYLGLRRIRPEAGFRLRVAHGTASAAGRVTTLAGKATEAANDIFWHEFCSQPELELTVSRVPGCNAWFYNLEWHDAVGPSSARDIIMRNLTTSALRRYRTPHDPRPMGGISAAIDVPARTLVLDVLLHDDVYPDCQPQIRTIATGLHGRADPNDRTRDDDVLPIEEHFEPLGHGIERYWAEEIPDYIEMLRQACDTAGWDAQCFRGFRTRIEYPVFNSEIQFIYELPLAPSTPPAMPNANKSEPE